MPEHTTALILDQCAADRARVADILHDRLGFRTVYPVADGNEALALLRSTPVDWLFVAWRIGQTTAADLLARLRRWPELSQVPGILLFDSDEPQPRVQALVAGAADYLQKPLEEETLVRLFQRLCGLHRQPGAGGIDCELDLGFDEFNLYRAELLEISERGCVLRTSSFKPRCGEVGDIGTLTVRCPHQSPLELNGQVVSREHRRGTAKPCLPLEIGFSFAGLGEGEQARLRQLIERWRQRAVPLTAL